MEPRSRPHDARSARAEAVGRLENTVIDCARCERLVEWRREVAAAPRASFAAETYWGRPLAGFGDVAATLLVVGLAPAAHGGNRTGRMFTGDRTGDFLFAALHRAGYANQPTSTGPGDGLELTGAFLTAAVRCAPPQNRPTPAERECCSGYLAGELELLEDVQVILALGAFALEALWRHESVSGPIARRQRRPRFAHGLEVPLGSPSPGAATRTLLASYHPSQRNVFTGLLDTAMFDAVLARAGKLGAGPGTPRSPRS